jgi:hypothetical protein
VHAPSIISAQFSSAFAPKTLPIDFRHMHLFAQQGAAWLGIRDTPSPMLHGGVVLPSFWYLDDF